MNLEIIYWQDSCSVDAWEPADTKRKPSECQTAGFVVYEDDDCISIASSLAFDDGQPADCCLTMTIPKTAITGRSSLEAKL